MLNLQDMRFRLGIPESVRSVNDGGSLCRRKVSAPALMKCVLDSEVTRIPHLFFCDV